LVFWGSLREKPGKNCYSDRKVIDREGGMPQNVASRAMVT